MRDTILTLFSFLFFTTTASTQNGSLRCYVCELEQTNACQTNPDVTTLTSVECTELKYPTPREGDALNVSNYVLSKSLDGKFRVAPLVGEIFQGTERKNSHDQDAKYVCLTLELSSGDKKGVSRLCERHPRNVENVCDFIRKEINPAFTVDDCKSCDSDNCNSGSVIYSSFIVFVFLFVMVF